MGGARGIRVHHMYGISINNLGSHMLIGIPNKGSGTVRCLGKNDNLACITVDCVK